MSAAVVTRDPAYLVAIAELPLSARVGEDPRGAIVVLPAGARTGADTVAAAVRAQEDGAVALVLADAARLEADDLDALHADVRIPVVIARPRARADVAADLATAITPGAVRAVVVEAFATAADGHGVLRDAVAWARLLAGGALSRTAAVSSTAGSLALLEHAGLPVTVMRSAARTGAPVIRAHTIGHERLDVTIDDGALVQRVERTGADGTRTAPHRFETLARLTLRRAIAAAAGEISPDDLDGCRHDARLAAEISRTPAP